jgi:hypothetical protein
MNLKPIVAMVAEERTHDAPQAARRDGPTVAQLLGPGHHGAPGETA